jgi:Fur family transcriptional regulator, ferric uptake regulator
VSAGCCGAKPPLADLTDLLRRHARKITGPRQAILAALRGRGPMTHREVHDALGSDACDLATVYRNLRTLEELGLVARCEFGDGSARFELAGGPRGHHHHLICRRCSRVVEIDECLPAGLEEAIARRHGFTEVAHRLEFFGVCVACRGAA